MDLTALKKSIQPLREEIIHHPLYHAIETAEDLMIFMEHHVFAVWDFMSLLKTLQNQLTCVKVPWFPIGDAETRFLINEIVIGEESDVDHLGNRVSHFELYVQAMLKCGANTSQIEHFLELVRSGKTVQDTLLALHVEKGIAQFVNGTFGTIESTKAHLVAAVFTFGREELIPDMFLSMVNDLADAAPERIDLFKYYLERHIEIDGGHHSELAYKMTENLCGTNEEYWAEAEREVVKALQNRIALWDAALEKIQRNKLPSLKK